MPGSIGHVEAAEIGPAVVVARPHDPDGEILVLTGLTTRSQLVADAGPAMLREVEGVRNKGSAASPSMRLGR